MPHTAYAVVTANSISDGQRVYLTGCDEWSPDLTHAEMISQDEHAAFRLFVATRQTRLVTGPELAQVTIDADGLSLSAPAGA